MADLHLDSTDVGSASTKPPTVLVAAAAVDVVATEVAAVVDTNAEDTAADKEVGFGIAFTVVLWLIQAPGYGGGGGGDRGKTTQTDI